MPKLAGAERDEVGEQAVEAGERNDEGKRTERFEKMGGQELRAHGVVDDLIHGADVCAGKVGVELYHRPL
jgi:hypothetical protein